MDLRTEHTWRDGVFPLGVTFHNEGLQKFLNQGILVPAKLPTSGIGQE